MKKFAIGVGIVLVLLLAWDYYTLRGKVETIDTWKTDKTDLLGDFEQALEQMAE